MSNPKTLKSCAVPQCSNTTNNAPEKLFFHVPTESKMRKKWIIAMKRILDPFGAKSNVYCCEDHFDIEVDMENYMKYKLIGGIVKLKKGTVPHKFDCQQKREDKPKESAVQTQQKIEHSSNLLSKESVTSMVDANEKPQEVFITPGDYRTAIEDPFNLVDSDECQKTSKLKKTNTSSCVSTHETYNSDQGSLDHDPDSGAESENETQFYRTHVQKTALYCISREPQLLLGLPKQCYFCIDILSQTTKCSPRNIMISLKKIRLYQSNAILALDFGITKSTVNKILRGTLPTIASVLKSLVYFPPSYDVRMNLPIPFRKNYSQVQSIINCFEIQIEKPVNPIKQTLTWSNYKRCYTIKYLVSITPDGLINFISPGYGGRTTDSVIFEDCGILKALPEGAAVLVDRGFTNISSLLQQNRQTLVRLPIVERNPIVKPTETEILQTKNIEAIRMHIYRAIGRLRDFGCMLPHFTVDLKEVDLLDTIVTSACGIVNLQSSFDSE